MSSNQEHTLVASSAIIAGMATFFFVSPWNSEKPIDLTQQPIVVSYQVQEAPKKVVIKDSRAPNYWDKVYAIESSSGKQLFIPSDKRKNITTCRWTKNACGFFMITNIAIRDIKICKGKVNQCMVDRLDYDKSLIMAKAYQKRLVELGCNYADDWLRYSCFNQGATGIKYAIASSRYGKTLPKKIRVNFIRNISGISKTKARKMSSKQLAKLYLNHWKKRFG